MIKEVLRRKRTNLAGKMSYRKAQFIIGVATLLAMPVATYAGDPAKKGATILDNIINKVFGPLGKIVGGFMVVGGVFKYLMAQKDEDARGQHGAVMAIAVGALLFGASLILSGLNISSFITGDGQAATTVIRTFAHF